MEDRLRRISADRPSVLLAETRSPKGAKTLRHIIVAAKAVFIREGHAGFSLRKVAAEAGVAVGNVNYYFTSKRALVEAMLREELADYAQAHVDHCRQTPDSPLDVLLNVVGFYVANGRETHMLFYQIWGYAGVDNRARDFVRDLYKEIGRLIYSLVAAANPSLSQQEVGEAALQIVSLEEGLKLFRGIVGNSDMSLTNAEDQVRELTRRIVRSN